LLYIAQITTTQSINSDGTVNNSVKTMNLLQQIKNEAAVSTTTTTSSEIVVKREMMQTRDSDVVVDHSEVVETTQDESVAENVVENDEACDSSFVITPDYIQQSKNTNSYFFLNSMSNCNKRKIFFRIQSNTLVVKVE
jgi:hypothetical protein